MGWFLRKLDSFAAAVFAASFGVTLSQLQAFLHQYLQRLGGHLDEARLHLERIQTDQQLQSLETSARDALIKATELRIDALQESALSIQNAGVLSKPFVFFWKADPDIVAAAATDFQPAIPIDPASLVYAGVAMIAALILYDFLKVPFRAIFKRKQA